MLIYDSKVLFVNNYTKEMDILEIFVYHNNVGHVDVLDEGVFKTNP